MQTETINENINEVKPEKKSAVNSILPVITKVFKSFFKVVVGLLRSFIAFFLALGAMAKVTFIIILVIFCIFAYLVGYQNGQTQVKKEVIQKSGYSINELEELRNQLDYLRVELQKLK